MEFLDTISKHKDLIASLKDILSMFALIIGGVWTYKAFIEKRLAFPRARGNFLVSDFPANDENTLLRVELEIQNIGESMMQISYMFARIQQIQPTPYVEGVPFVIEPDPNTKEIPWPLIEEYTYDERKIHREIEPSEFDSLSFDFLIPRHIKRVYINVYIRNRRKKSKWYYFGYRRDIGWDFSTIYEIQTSKDPSNEHSKENNKANHPETKATTNDNSSGAAQAEAS